MAWQFTVDGQVFREGDLTIDDLEALEDATGLTWHRIHPLHSATAAKAMAITMLVRAGREAGEASKVVGAMNGNDLITSITTYEDDDDLPAVWEDGFPPKADEPSTPT